MKTLKLVLGVVLFSLVIGCIAEADLASRNLSKNADEFRITRRIVFYNGITGEYILVIEGLCALGNNDSHGEVTVTCKTGDGEYKKHFLGISDNVTYFAEQVESAKASPYHYKVVLTPSSLIPEIKLR